MTTLYFKTGGTLKHHGIKGQKWGVRRYRNADGSLTPAGIKRYAKKGYTDDAYNENKTVVGKAYDKFTSAHKIQGDVRYSTSSKQANKARAEKYLADKEEAEKRDWSDDARTAYELRRKSVNEMSNAELKKLNERSRLEKEYANLNPNKIEQGWKYVVGAAAVTNTAVNLYNNSDKIVKIGKSIANRMMK